MMENQKSNCEMFDLVNEGRYSWSQWIFINLLEGQSPKSLVKAVIDSDAIDKTSLIKEVYEVNRGPYLRAARGVQRNLDKRNWLLRTYDHLSTLDSRYSRDIERRPTPNFNVFVQDYYSKQIPVVFTGGIDHWPAKDKWCPKYFSKQLGESPVEVQFNRSQDSRYERNASKYKRKMPMSEFCSLVENGRRSNDYYLTANNNQENASEFAILFNDVRDFGVGYRSAEAIRTGCFLWFGPEGAFTPLHHDLTNNMLVQIYGRKKLTLIPAFQVQYIYNEHHVYSETDFPMVDLQKFPKMKHLTPIEIVLEPGEAAFIPIGWWHCVESLDVSISVSFTDFKLPNSYFNSFPNSDAL